MLYTPSPPVGTDPANRLSIMKEIGEHSQIVSVANATARNALLATITPTAAEPLWVYRQDTRQVELTTNGTSWTAINAGPASARLLRQSASQDIPNAVPSEVVFLSAHHDTSGFFSAGHLIIPANLGGLYTLTAGLQFENGDSTGAREIWIEAAGSEVARVRTSACTWWAATTTVTCRIAGGTMIRLVCFQDSGATLRTSVAPVTFLSCVRVEG